MAPNISLKEKENKKDPPPQTYFNFFLSLFLASVGHYPNHFLNPAGISILIVFHPLVRYHLESVATL